MRFPGRKNQQATGERTIRHDFRPRTGLVACGLWAVVTLVWFVLAAISGVGNLLNQLPWMVGSATLVWATCGRPRVIVNDEEVLLKNVFRDVHIPWSMLKEIGTQYALTLTTTDGRKFNAWAAPAGGRFGAAKVTQSDLRVLQWDEADGPLPSSATLRSDAGSAAAIVRITWKKVKAAGLPEGTQQVRIEPLLPILVLLAASVVGAVVVGLI